MILLQILNILAQIAYYLVLLFVGLSSLYFLVFTVAGLLFKSKQISVVDKKLNFHVIIPAYREDAVILETVKSALAHKSQHRFELSVVADSLQDETLAQLKKLDIHLLQINVAASTKTKALQFALDHVHGSFDHAIVLDADNIMQEGCIDAMAKKLNSGIKVVQGHRTAKNQNVSIAQLDALSEEINNTIFRKGHVNLGLSAALIGSGFACEYAFFKELIHEIEAVGGFDKELEVKIIAKGVKIAYEPRAIVLDEKTQQAGNFTTQRRRWLSAQIFYLKKYFGTAFSQGIKRGNIDLFDKVMQFMLPPRILALCTVAILAIVPWVVSGLFAYGNIELIRGASLAVFLLLVTTLLLALPRRMFNLSLFSTLLSLPKGVLLMAYALLRTKGANRTFLHTQHGIKK